MFYVVYRERTTLWETKDLDDPNDREGPVRGKQCGYIWFSLQRIIISGENLHCHMISLRWELLNLVPSHESERSRMCVRWYRLCPFLHIFYRNLKLLHINPMVIFIHMGRKYGMLWKILFLNKGNNKITELRTILQRESQNS